MKTYNVEYKLTWTNEVKNVDVLANNKEDAYDKAVYEEIPKREGEPPYSAWVNTVTYSNGKVKTFNNFEGNPY